MSQVLPKASVTELPEGLRSDTTPDSFYVGSYKYSFDQDIHDDQTQIYAESCLSTAKEIFINDQTGNVYVPLADGKTFAVYEMENHYGIWDCAKFWMSEPRNLFNPQMTDILNDDHDFSTNPKLPSTDPNRMLAAFIIDASLEGKDLNLYNLTQNDVGRACAYWIYTEERDSSYSEKAQKLLPRSIQNMTDPNLAENIINRYYSSEKASLLVVYAKNTNIDGKNRFSAIQKNVVDNFWISHNQTEKLHFEALINLLDEKSDKISLETKADAAILLTHRLRNGRYPTDGSDRIVEITKQWLFQLAKKQELPMTSRISCAVALAAWSELSKEDHSKSMDIILSIAVTPSEDFSTQTDAAFEYLKIRTKEGATEPFNEVFVAVLSDNPMDSHTVLLYATLYHNLTYIYGFNPSKSLEAKLTSRCLAVAKNSKEATETREKARVLFCRLTKSHINPKPKLELDLYMLADPTLTPRLRAQIAEHYATSNIEQKIKNQMADSMNDILDSNQSDKDTMACALAYLDLKGPENLTLKETQKLQKMVKYFSTSYADPEYSYNTDNLTRKLFLYSPHRKVREAMFRKRMADSSDIAGDIRSSHLETKDKLALVELALELSIPLINWDLRELLEGFKKKYQLEIINEHNNY